MCEWDTYFRLPGCFAEITNRPADGRTYVRGIFFPSLHLRLNSLRQTERKNYGRKKGNKTKLFSNSKTAVKHESSLSLSLWQKRRLKKIDNLLLPCLAFKSCVVGTPISAASRTQLLHFFLTLLTWRHSWYGLLRQCSSYLLSFSSVSR